MTAITEKQEVPAINQLEPTERAYLALSADHNEQSLVELAGKYVDATEIKDKTDYRMVMRGGIELMKARTAIQATGKAARDDANRFRSAVIDEQNRLIEIIQPEENRLRFLRKDYDTEQERIATEARHLEQRRIADITERIQTIKNQTEGLLGADADAIQMRLDAVSTILCNETLFGEFADTAMEVKAAAVTSLETALAERVALEEQQAEQQRVAEEQATRQAELDRQAKDQLEREAAAVAESQARAYKDQCIIDIRQSSDGAVGMTADELNDSLSALEMTDVSEEIWGNYAELAKAAVSQTTELLSTALVARITMDKGIAALARQKAEQQKAEDERLAEKHAEQDRQAEMERQVEQERIDREKAEQLKTEQKAEAERQEALRPEKDKLMEWAEYLDGMTGPDVLDPQLKELRNQVEQIVCLAGSNLIKTIEAL